MTNESKARNYLCVDRIAKYKESDVKSLVVLLDKHAADAKADQRERCADNILKESPEGQDVPEWVGLACLNATGESDE